MSEFNNLVNKAREQAKRVGLKESDLKEALALARERK
jgi:hypothetical protein